MGCCCSQDKENNQEEGYDERSRLIPHTADLNQKSRFVDSNNQTINAIRSGPSLQSNANNLQGGLNNHLVDQSLNNSLSKQNGAGGSGNGGMSSNSGNGQNNMNESNHMFDKILSEVIHVTPFEQRSSNASNMNCDTNLVQEMPIKLKGLIEPVKQQLCLPEGVPSGNTLSVLAAQPPFASDIRLINNLANEANFCVNNYTLNVPENVAFDFNPVV